MFDASRSALPPPEVTMEARPCQVLEFFNGTKQMLVPLFQRPYEWGSREWETLWADLLEQYERDLPPDSRPLVM
jgi:uncharacterized protein with ParB-like and HNH nuclease domain